MDSEAKFYTTLVLAVLVGFSVLVGGFVAGHINSNEKYYAAVTDCTAAGGQWMPVSNVGTCIRR